MGWLGVVFSALLLLFSGANELIPTPIGYLTVQKSSARAYNVRNKCYEATNSVAHVTCQGVELVRASCYQFSFRIFVPNIKN